MNGKPPQKKDGFHNEWPEINILAEQIFDLAKDPLDLSRGRLDQGLVIIPVKEPCVVFLQVEEKRGNANKGIVEDSVLKRRGRRRTEGLGLNIEMGGF